MLFDVGSAGCALSDTATEVIGWHVVQAVGACAGVVLARAMVRDLFERDRGAQMLSTLITVMAVAPRVGPLVGGQVLTVASWPWTFWLMVVIGVGLVVALFTVPETLAPDRRDVHALRHALGRYAELLRDRRILAYTGIGGFFYADMAGSPFAYISHYHVPPRYYGLLFGSVILAIMAVDTLNARLVPRLGSDRLLRWGAALADGTAWPLGLTMGLAGIGSFACTLLLPRTSMG